MARWILAAVGALLLLSCEKVREQVVDDTCVTWIEDVQPVLRQQCGTCHGPELLEGSYDLSSYAGALAAGTDDVANAIAGDATSRLVVHLDPAVATEPHRPASAAVHPLVEKWVVKCRLGYRNSRIHEPGILDPSSETFHGSALAASGYDFARCAECHGNSFTGGAAESSCRTCHTDGPTDCAVCHSSQDEPHRLHERFDCASCHVVPSVWGDGAHADAPPAEVDFSLLAVADGHVPTASDGRCADTYCHGVATPVWLEPREDACGTCHELPPTSHARDDCAGCHQTVVGEEGFVDPNRHVDGVVDVGSEPGCEGCHVITDALHRRHLEPRLGLSNAVNCGDCHLVPEQVTDPGHIDSVDPVEVFVPEILQDSLAAKRGASPIYDASQRTCSDVYCHGPTSIVWMRSTESRVFCGSCHDLPPVDAIHDSTMTIQDCSDCHSTVDRFGNVLFEDGESEHLDGKVDL